MGLTVDMWGEILLFFHTFVAKFTQENMTLKKVPTSMLGKNKIFGTVLFTILFAILFLNLYIPFSDTAWFGLGNSETFINTVKFLIIAIFILIGSRTGMHYYSKHRPISYLLYGVWCAIEIAMICWLYTEISVRVNTGLDWSWFAIYKHALPYCAIALGSPYIMAIMYFMIMDAHQTIRLMSMENIVTDEVSKTGEKLKKITLCDNNGAIKMLVSFENLYYIQSDDNYIRVCYTDNQGELQRYMLRCSLKTIEENFKDTGLIRCSRQFIINASKISNIRKESGGYILELDNKAIPAISVTKNYADKVLAYFNNTISSSDADIE